MGNENGKLNVALLSMGGTIFSFVEKGVVRPAANIEELVAMVPRIQQVANVTLHSVVNLDSTNLNPSHWMALIKKIGELYDQYDAFVVAHGTNTLAFTATALALALGRQISKPIVITGSQLPLSMLGDDAHFNLEHAVAAAVAAKERGIAEVMVCFNAKIFRGCCTVKKHEFRFDAFDSPSLEPIGYVDSGGIAFASHAYLATNEYFRLPDDIGFCTDVLSIEMTPGLKPSIFSKMIEGDGDGVVKGIVLKSFGAGSVPDEGEESFLPFIRHATSRGVPVVVASKFAGGSSFKKVNDAPAIEALKAGAISSRNMTDIAAHVKLMYLIGLGTKYSQLVTRFGQSIVGEVS